MIRTSSSHTHTRHDSIGSGRDCSYIFVYCVSSTTSTVFYCKYLVKVTLHATYKLLLKHFFPFPHNNFNTKE